jgi:hypothetical protein
MHDGEDPLGHETTTSRTGPYAAAGIGDCIVLADGLALVLASESRLAFRMIAFFKRDARALRNRALKLLDALASVLM